MADVVYRGMEKYFRDLKIRRIISGMEIKYWVALCFLLTTVLLSSNSDAYGWGKWKSCGLTTLEGGPHMGTPTRLSFTERWRNCDLQLENRIQDVTGHPLGVDAQQDNTSVKAASTSLTRDSSKRGVNDTLAQGQIGAVALALEGGKTVPCENLPGVTVDGLAARNVGVRGFVFSSHDSLGHTREYLQTKK